MALTTPRTLCLLGSPRRGGNSDVLAARFGLRAEALGASVETIALADLSFSGCRNLFHCKTTLDHCGQVDGLTPVLEAITRADILVLASPVYFTSVSGQMKLAMDRFFSFFVPGYPTAKVKTRLSPGKHLVFLQTQGEPEERYADLMDSFSTSFTGLGFENQHLVRAWGVREVGDVEAHPTAFADCDRVADMIYGKP